MRTPPPRPWLALSLAAIAISTAAPLFRLAAPTHPIIAAATRLSVAALLLTPWSLPALRKLRGAHREIGLLGGAGLCYALHFGAWVWSLSLTSVAASVSLVTITPLLLGLLGWGTGRDAPSRALWVGLALASLGVLTISAGAPQSLGAGELLALLGAAAMAGYLLCARRLQTHLSPWALMGAAAGLGALFLWGAAFASGVPRMLSPGAWAPLLAAALLPQLVGHGLLTRALQRVSPAEVALFTLAEPPLSGLFAWLLFAELPPLEVLFGGGLILAGLCLTQLAERREAAAP